MKRRSLSSAGNGRIHPLTVCLCLERVFQRFLVFFLIVLVGGCATSPLTRAREMYFHGHLRQAAEEIGNASDISGRNKLLYYMEKGVILHRLGDYQGSTETLLKASRLMADQDVISLSRQTGSLLSTDLIVEYKGEYSERLWVHTYLMMNFLLLGRADEALVEAKQALQVYDAFPDALEKDYFSRALIALCYENLGEDTDAFIEYRKLMDLLPDSRVIARDLYRLGARLGRLDELKIFDDDASPPPIMEPAGELVVFYRSGQIATKFAGNLFIPPHTRISFPRYDDTPPPAARIRFADPVLDQGASRLTTDLSEVSRKSLEARAVGFAAKEAARIAAKEALIRTVNNNGNDLATLLVQGVAFLTEEADIRCWQTLPSGLTLIRLPLQPGAHRIRLSLLGGLGQVARTLLIPEFSIEAGQQKYLSLADDGGLNTSF